MDSIEICSLEDIPPGNCRAVRAMALDIALFNVEGTVHALENACLHAGAALSGGSFCGRTVTCPAHGWRYDVTTGALKVAPEKVLRTFPVLIADGKVLLQIEA